MAQDKVGQSWALYKLLEGLGETEPDINAFTRNAEQFHNSQFVELPILEYDFSLIRHLLFDHAEVIRFDMLCLSSYKPLAQLAFKIKGELKYHVMHARSIVRKLANVNEESIIKLQKSLDYALPYALGVFEESKYEEQLKSENIFAGEKLLEKRWKEQIELIINTTELNLPDWSTITPIYGGRNGVHTEHLQPLLSEMSEVFNEDPMSEW
jgi:ring-1,2-phenylacetyl-CoA epoxidase subunit PaaC